MKSNNKCIHFSICEHKSYDCYDYCSHYMTEESISAVAYQKGCLFTIMSLKAHHMKVVGMWNYLNLDNYKDMVSEEELKRLKEESASAVNIPWCSNCGALALFEQQESGEYTYCLSNYCPKCGAILNEEIANKSSKDSIKEQSEELNRLHKEIMDNLHKEKSNEN